jgi:phosphinothricin acetyltransferase
VRIREAVTVDLPAIVAVYNDAIPGRLSTADLEPVSVESRRAWFSSHGSVRYPLWVALEERSVLGWLSLSEFYGRAAYAATVEVSVYVASAAQRRGVATALLRYMLADAPDRGVKTLLGLVFRHNEPSLALFRRFAFETWGTLPRVAVIDGVRRDLVILGRHLV